jgi:hypothetical protein
MEIAVGIACGSDGECDPRDMAAASDEASRLTSPEDVERWLSLEAGGGSVSGLSKLSATVGRLQEGQRRGCQPRSGNFPRGHYVASQRYQETGRSSRRWHRVLSKRIALQKPMLAIQNIDRDPIFCSETFVKYLIYLGSNLRRDSE